MVPIPLPGAATPFLPKTMIVKAGGYLTAAVVAVIIRVLETIGMERAVAGASRQHVAAN